MKLSVSVPDDLWSQVFEPDDSPSDLVQRGIRLLAKAKAERVRPFGNAPDPDEFATRTLEESGDFHEHFMAAVASARQTREAGYTIGVDAALRSLTFAELELMIGRPRFRQDLEMELLEPEGVDLPETFLQNLWQDIHDYDQTAHLDKDARRVSATFLDAVVDGIRDAHAALVSEATSRPHGGAA